SQSSPPAQGRAHRKSSPYESLQIVRQRTSSSRSRLSFEIAGAYKLFSSGGEFAVPHHPVEVRHALLVEDDGAVRAVIELDTFIGQGGPLRLLHPELVQGRRKAKHGARTCGRLPDRDPAYVAVLP